LLSLPGEPRHGVLLPGQAVVWVNGMTWVYRQTSEQEFQRQPVQLDSSLDDGWFVSGGLKVGDKVVTAASQQLVSEEVKDQIGGD
jgi:hypothetical protein